MTVQVALLIAESGFNAHHPAGWLVLLLAAILLFGCFEGFVVGRRDFACVTWFWGLLELTGWIAHPLTKPRICMGSVVFVSGLILIIVYYRGRVPIDRPRAQKEKR